MHERAVGRKETEQDSFFARILLNDLRKRITISDNSGNVMIDSPGAIQGRTINIKTQRKRISINPPPGTIGDDINRRRYVEYLIKRYNEFAGADPTRKGEFRYGVISKNLEDRFGAPWRILPVDRCEEVIAYLQQRISRTRQALINKGKGWKAYSTFDEFLKKYGE